MIRNSFIFLERINEKTESNIWKQGIRDWDDFIKADKIKGISIKRKKYYGGQLLKARKALYSFDSAYFNKLPLKETWRIYDFFKEDAVFLDIETTGLSIYDSINIITLFDGIETKTMIKGINFDINILKKELAKYKLIVTFNGSSFDLPFINKKYPNLLPQIPHFDLKSITEKCGLKGGLKEIEKQLGIKRNKIIERFYSGDPSCLMRMYKATGDEYYLNLLIEYNEDDVINLKKIADYCVKKMREITGRIPKDLNTSFL